ncbi:MAG: efflux RND transporter periplasmic adaptor subunit [Opitutales bacterium]
MNQPSSHSPIVRRRKSRKKWIIIGGSVLLVALVVAGVLTRKKDKGIMITTEKAFVKTITQVVTATGKVQPEVEVKITPEVGGEIIALPFKEGAAVKKGNVIVKIKPDLYEAQVQQAEANLSAAKASAIQAQAQLLKAQQDFQRSEDLYRKQLISDSDELAAKTTLNVARANTENAAAQIRSQEGMLSQAKDQLSKTTIYSPMDGTVSSLSSEVGERVIGGGQFAGTEIMRVADLSNMEVRVNVNENDIVNVKPDDRTIISIDAYPDRKFNGTVKEIGSSSTDATAALATTQNTTSDEVTNFLVKVRVTDRDVRLRPGMSAIADIQTQTVNNVVVVPIQSVTVRAEGGKTAEDLQKQKAKEAHEKSGNDLEVADERDQARRTQDQLKRVVFIVENGKVRLQPVATGIADNTYVEVKSGVKVGDVVVAGSYAAISRTLKDGAAIQIEKPKKDGK